MLAVHLEQQTTELSPSFIVEALQGLETSENKKEELHLMKDIAGQVCLAVTDTTIAALRTSFLTMVRYPKAQKKLQDSWPPPFKVDLPVHEDIDAHPRRCSLRLLAHLP